MSFEIMPADIDEKLIRRDDPVEMTRVIAHAKTDALLLQIQGPAVLITADTVVTCNGNIREKQKHRRKREIFCANTARIHCKP